MSPGRAYKKGALKCAPSSQPVVRGTRLVVGAAVRLHAAQWSIAHLPVRRRGRLVDAELHSAHTEQRQRVVPDVSLRAGAVPPVGPHVQLLLVSLCLPPTNPSITSVSSSGCTSLSTLQLSACQPGSVLNIRGLNLNSSCPALKTAPNTPPPTVPTF